MVRSDNISITKATKDERSQKAKKVDEANAKIDEEIKAELAKPKPSGKKISRLLKKKEHNSRTLKNSEIDEMLKEKRVTNKICQKETKGMSDEAKKAHREKQKPISKVRAKVEHAIGTIKFEMKHTKSRYIGLLRNHIDFVFLALASNLKTLAHRQLEAKRCQIS